MSSSRERVIETAARLVAERGAANLTMAEVARESGVSRQMVYLSFENRAGLFTAITRYKDERARITERFERAFALEPAAGAEMVMREWLAYVPEILPIARELNAAAMIGADGGEAWNTRMDELRRMFRAAARRLDLREPWTPDTAGDWMWSRTHVAMWDHLVVHRGWTPEDFTELTVGSTLTELLAHR